MRALPLGTSVEVSFPDGGTLNLEGGGGAVGGAAGSANTGTIAASAKQRFVQSLNLEGGGGAARGAEGSANTGTIAASAKQRFVPTAPPPPAVEETTLEEVCLALTGRASLASLIAHEEEVD